MYHEPGCTIVLGSVLTNMSHTMDELLELIGFDEDEFCEEHGFDEGIDRQCIVLGCQIGVEDQHA